MSKCFAQPADAVIRQKTEQLWHSTAYFAVLLAVVAVSMALGTVIPATVLLVLCCTWMLVFCRDFLAAVLPFLLIFLLSTLEYDNLSVFLPCAPLAIFLAAGLIVHLLRWPVPLRVGSSTVGWVLVSAATLLGGAGVISKADYFAPLSLYYTLGLGVGLLACYVLLFSELSVPRDYDLLHKLMQMLYALGLTMVLAIGFFYVHHWALFSEHWILPRISYRNFAATILVSTLPAVFYMALKNLRHLAVVVLWAAALFFSGSRSALLFGGLMLLLGLIYLARRNALPLWALVLTVAIAGSIVTFYGDEIYAFFVGARENQDQFINPNEDRLLLLAQGREDFLAHPLLGIGLGNSQNTVLFDGVPGSMVFYHNAVMQVLGSMGLVGAIAYSVLLYSQVRLLVRRQDGCRVVTFFFLGMLLVSMTNPGVFCPLPNALLTVIVLTVLEVITDSSAIAARSPHL